MKAFKPISEGIKKILIYKYLYFNPEEVVYHSLTKQKGIVLNYIVSFEGFKTVPIVKYFISWDDFSETWEDYRVLEKEEIEVE